MNARTCIVMPGRLGDIINILPCARDIALKEGGVCALMVSAEFASVVEGCSYVMPLVVSSHFTDVQPVIEQARQMFPRVLVGKTNEKNIGVSTQCAHFNEESWRQVGYGGRWGALPLVFDRRDRKREARLVEAHNAKGVVLVNFLGKSAPYPYARPVMEMLRASGRRIVDIGGIMAFRLFDLLGLMDAAALLVTADTATLHLATASGVPVVNLIGDSPTRWHGSRPRNNSVEEIPYSTDLKEQIARIRAAVDAAVAADVTPGTRKPHEWEWRPQTWHVWSDYPMEGDTLRRHEMAKKTWERTRWIPFPVPVGERVIVDENPIRRLPFLRDVVDAVVKAAGPRDKIVLTNTDTCVGPLAAEVVQQMGACLYSFRRDMQRIDTVQPQEEILKATLYTGADLFAFTVKWWEEHGRALPDLVLGAEAWDWCLRVLMKKDGVAVFQDLIYHEKHGNIWEQPELRYTLPSQQHNRRLATEFLAANGVVFQ